METTLRDALKEIATARHEAETGRVNLERIVFAARQLIDASVHLAQSSETRRMIENLEAAIQPHEITKVNPFENCGCEQPWHECGQ